MNKEMANEPDHQSKASIALIGLPGSGKTTMLASFDRCLQRRSHGFESNLNVRFPDMNGLKRLEALRQQLVSGDKNNQLPPQVDKAFELIEIGIDFRMANHSSGPTETKLLEGYYPFRIHDLTTRHPIFEMITKTDLVTKSPLHTAVMEDFFATLRRADSLIICHPAGSIMSQLEGDGFVNLMSQIASGMFGSYKTVILALTHYDRMVSQQGAGAFFAASEPQAMMGQIKSCFSNDPALDSGMRALLSSSADIYVETVSAYGFLKQSGSTNLNRFTGTPLAGLVPAQYLSREKIQPISKLEDAGQLIELAGLAFSLDEKGAKLKAGALKAVRQKLDGMWLPFLTADPFVTAVSGIPSEFMLPLADFIDQIDQIPAHSKLTPRFTTRLWPSS